MINENDKTNRVPELVEEIEAYKQVIENAQNAMNAAEDELREELYLESLNSSELTPE